MAQSKNKTTETDTDAYHFLALLPDENRRADSLQLVKIMEEASGFGPRVWRENIVGFGRYHYRYASGHEGDAPIVAFAPRKNELVVYLSSAFDEREQLLSELGKHKSGKGCIYIKKLADVNVETLRRLIKASLTWTQKKYPG